MSSLSLFLIILLASFEWRHFVNVRTFSSTMACRVSLYLQYQVALIEADNNLRDINLDIYAHICIERIKKGQRRWWSEPWEATTVCNSRHLTCENTFKDTFVSFHVFYCRLAGFCPLFVRRVNYIGWYLFCVWPVTVWSVCVSVPYSFRETLEATGRFSPPDNLFSHFLSVWLPLMLSGNVWQHSINSSLEGFLGALKAFWKWCASDCVLPVDAEGDFEVIQPGPVGGTSSSWNYVIEGMIYTKNYFVREC